MKKFLLPLLFLGCSLAAAEKESADFIEKICANPEESVFVIAEFRGHECVVVLVKHYDFCQCKKKNEVEDGGL